MIFPFVRISSIQYYLLNITFVKRKYYNKDLISHHTSSLGFIEKKLQIVNAYIIIYTFYRKVYLSIFVFGINVNPFYFINATKYFENELYIIPYFLRFFLNLYLYNF